MVILKNTETFDVGNFCSPFHDGGIFYIKNYGNKIRIYMDSFPLFFEDYIPPDPSPQYFKLTTQNSYKGYLLLENIIDWSVDGKKNCEFVYNYVDSLEILDFEIKGNEVNFLVVRRFLNDKKMDSVWERYIFHANSINWINFESIKEDEYECEANKKYFFENIRDLMGKPQN